MVMGVHVLVLLPCYKKYSAVDIYNKKICIIVALNCPYGGNIIPSLRTLAEVLTNKYQVKVCWIFPKQADRDWLNELEKKYEVEFTTRSYGKSFIEIKQIFEKWKPDWVHTHYEAYDIVVAKVVKKLNWDIRMVWHIHDYMTLYTSGESLPLLRKLKRHFSLFLHYGFYGKHASLIAVSDEMAAFCGHYKMKKLSFPPRYFNNTSDQSYINHVKVLLNGIDLTRIIGNRSPSVIVPFTFLSYGGQNVHKRIDYLLMAGEILKAKGCTFRILLTKGVDTMQVVRSIYHEKIPEWLVLTEQTDRIVDILKLSSCYVSTSVHETMSTAIAEASIFGLPIIQSDIPGTDWNAKTPSAFLFKSRDEKDLADKMELVMKMDSDCLLCACKKSKKLNKERLSLEKWCDNIIEFYRNL